MRSLLLVTVPLLALVPASAQAPLHYKFEMTGNTTVDMSAMGMAAQNVPISAFALLSVTVSDTAGGILAHVVIDSVVYDGGPMMAQAAAMMPPAMTASGKGAFYHLYLVNGKIQGKALPSVMSMEAGVVAGAVPLLFPGVRSTANAGDRWSDTTVADTVMAGGAGTGKTTTIDNWTVTSKDNAGTVLDATETGGMTMDMAGGMGQMAVQTTGTKHVNIGTRGAAHDSNASSAMNGTLTMSMGIMTIKGTTTMSLTPLP